jgi:phosphatidylserine/phosphatidylglycerophosphate/cardiolipin synthase-like enzyme
MYSLPATGKVKGVYFSLGITPSKDKDLSCVNALCSLLDGAKESAYIAIYSLTEPNILNSLIKAHQRGVDVIIVADYSQSKGKTMKAALQRLEDAGVLVKIAVKQKAFMHNKVTIVDGKFVATGSFNYSKNASVSNDENLVVLEGLDIAEKYFKYVFERVLKKETLVRI